MQNLVYKEGNKNNNSDSETFLKQKKQTEKVDFKTFNFL